MDHIKTISVVNEQEIDVIMEIDQISNPMPWSRCSLMQYIKQERGWSLKINQHTCAFLLFSNHIDHCDLLLIALTPIIDAAIMQMSFYIPYNTIAKHIICLVFWWKYVPPTTTH